MSKKTHSTHSQSKWRTLFICWMIFCVIIFTCKRTWTNQQQQQQKMMCIINLYYCAILNHSTVSLSLTHSPSFVVRMTQAKKCYFGSIFLCVYEKKTCIVITCSSAFDGVNVVATRNDKCVFALKNSIRNRCAYIHIQIHAHTFIKWTVLYWDTYTCTTDKWQHANTSTQPDNERENR